MIQFSNLNNMESNRENESEATSDIPTQDTQPHCSSSSYQLQPKKQDEELITDFSGMFKRKGNWVAQKPKTKTKQTKSPNWLLEIPAKLDISIEDITCRRVMDLNRWTSAVKSTRPLKIIASVCTCWNYLTAANGTNFLTIPACLEILSPHLSLQEITVVKEHERFNLIKKTVQYLSKAVNKNLSVEVIVKLSEPSKKGESTEEQKNKLLEGLTASKRAYIYLGHEDVFCPVGYDVTPLKQIQAYDKLEKMSSEDQELWIISSSLGKNEPSFSIKRWSDVQKDLETAWPQYFDIKEPKQGPRLRPDVTQDNKEEKRGTSNCIIQIRLE